MSDPLWVQVKITINGQDCFYTAAVSPEMWEYPEYKLLIIKSLKEKCIRAATAGMEPIVEVFDEMPPSFSWRSGIPELAQGSSVEISCSSD